MFRTPQIVKPLALFLAIAGLGAAAPASAPTADSIVHRMEARNAGLDTFQTRVHVNLHMLTFPFYSPSLDGTEYFKKPDKHGVVFDHSPWWAKGIKSLFGAVDEPSEWRKDSNIAYAGDQTIGGKTLLVLRMTKKIYSDQTKDTLAYVDPASFEVVRMQFNYTNGDQITMTQTYKQQGPYAVVGTRHLEIKRRVHAVADATYAAYQTNVAVNDSVFTQQK